MKITFEVIPTRDEKLAEDAWIRLTSSGPADSVIDKHRFIAGVKYVLREERDEISNACDALKEEDVTRPGFAYKYVLEEMEKRQIYNAALSTFKGLALNPGKRLK